MNKEEIQKNFLNEKNMYYGHGTDNIDLVDSIFENGLRCSHRSNTIDYTTIGLGRGREGLFDKNLDLFNNWPHLQRKQIIIASIPIEYQNISVDNTISQEALIDVRREPNEVGYLRPEFIKGMYNAETGEFVNNDRYYENLPQEEQDNLFAQVKEKYIEVLKEQIIRSKSSFKRYKATAEFRNIGTPLSDEEIEKLDSELPEFKEDDLFLGGIIYEDLESSIKEKATISGINDEAKFLKQEISRQNDEINLEEMEWD